MAEVLVNSGSGVTEMALSTPYVLGDRVVINKASTGTNYLVARRYVWECTLAGTTDTIYPAYSASYTPDSSVMSSGTAQFTCRNIGYSNGATKDWTFATIFLAYAFRAAVTDGDIIKVHKTHTEMWAAAWSAGPLVSVKVLCVDKDASEALSVMDSSLGYTIGTTGTSSFTIFPTTNARAYMYGLAFKVGSGGTGGNTMLLGASWEGQLEYESCLFWLATTGSTGYISTIGSSYSNYFKFKNCDLKFGHVGQYLYSGEGRMDFEGCSILSSGSKPNVPLQFGSSPGGRKVFTGCDFSWAGTSVIGQMAAGHNTIEFSNCLFPAGVPVWYTGTPTRPDLGGGEAFVFNCASGNTHYNFGYYNNLGSVEAVTSIYANDGALYDGTNHVTWMITTTSYASDTKKFETPWIEKYHAGVAAITPFLEILRDGSTTAYTDAEVWGEFSYQGTTGNPLAVLVNDRCPPLGTPANQAAGVGVAGWTGDAASAWSGKLAPGAAVTPAVIGMLRARVVVAAPSITVYVDPKIRT